MNQAQLLSAIRWIMTTGGAYLASKGYVSNETVQAIGGAALAAIPFVWSMFVHKD
jgi:hypothetical protein